MFLSRSPKAAGLGRRQGGDGDVKEKGSSLDLGEVWCPSSTDLCRSPTALQLRLSGGRSDMSSLKAQRHRRGQNSTQIKGLWDYYATLTMECAIFFLTLFVVALGLGCCERDFSVVIGGDYSLVAVQWLLLLWRRAPGCRL